MPCRRGRALRAIVDEGSMCCPDFSVGRLETRYDVEQVLRTAFFPNRSGAPDDAFAYAPCPGASEAHARAA